MDQQILNEMCNTAWALEAIRSMGTTVAMLGVFGTLLMMWAAWGREFFAAMMIFMMLHLMIAVFIMLAGYSIAQAVTVCVIQVVSIGVAMWMIRK